MKAFLILVVIVGVAVFGVKWFTEKDVKYREKQEAAANATPVPTPTPKVVVRSPLDPPARSGQSSMGRPSSGQPSNAGGNPGQKSDWGTALDRKAYR